MIPSLVFTATTPSNSLVRNPVSSHNHRLDGFRNECLNALSGPVVLQKDLERFWNGFWLFYPDHKTYAKMAALAGVTATTMRSYYLGKFLVPKDIWRRLMINAINHITADQASIRLSLENNQIFLPASLKATNNSATINLAAVAEPFPQAYNLARRG